MDYSFLLWISAHKYIWNWQCKIQCEAPQVQNGFSNTEKVHSDALTFGLANLSLDIFLFENSLQ